jgi:5'-nucleotidase
MFGRVDLVWDTAAKKLVTDKMSYTAGVTLFETACDKPAKAFCAVKDGKPVYEGVPVEPSAEVVALADEAKKGLSVVSARKLGTVVGGKPLTVHRIFESPLANSLTDVLREVSQVEIAFINTGGIRNDLPAGDFTYNDFFRVMPFNNIAVVLDPLPRVKLLQLLLRSAQTCGEYGTLMSSGLRVLFERDCKKVAKEVVKVDTEARLLKVETLAGQVIFDASVPELSQIEQGPDMSFRVATLDFLAARGGGYEYCMGVPLVEEVGILREVLTDHWLAEPASLALKTDGRWKDVAPAAPVPAPVPSALPSALPLPVPSLSPVP